MAERPWPYADEPPPAIDRPPSWECPEGLCECHPRTEADDRQFSIMLFERDRRRMPRARCRVWLNGRIVNEDTPFADDAGWITIRVGFNVQSAFVEWAPQDMPLRAPYPYRKHVHVAIDGADDGERTRKRLANLGYDRQFPLSENLAEFRRDFGYDKPPIVDERAFSTGDDERASSTGDESGAADDDAKVRRDLGELNEGARVEGAGDGEPGPVPPAPQQQAPRLTGGSTATPGQVSARSSARVVIHAFSFFALSFPPVMTQAKPNGGRRPKQQRWGAGDSQPVGGAEVRFFDSSDALVTAVRTNNASTTINRFGSLSLDLSALPDGNYTMTLTLVAGQQLRPRTNDDVPCRSPERGMVIGNPISASDNFSGDAVGHKRFRPAEVLVELRAGGFNRARIANDIRFGVNGTSGGFVKAFRENARTLWVDWRPDRVQLRSPGAKVSRNRPGTTTPLSPVQFIHLHHTEAPTPGSSIDTFIQSSAKGAHYLVDVDGFFVKLAHESQVARHTGKAAWFDLDSSPSPRTIRQFNDISAGIEHVHLLGRSFPDEQILATAFLLGGITITFGVPRHNVLGDGETALQKKGVKRLGRKVDCPGKDYPWDRLEGIVALAPSSGPVTLRRGYNGHFSGPPPHPPIGGGSTDAAAIRDLQGALADVGYFVPVTGVYDDPTLRAVEAFRNRFMSGPRRLARRNAAQDGAGEAAANFDLVELLERVFIARGGATY